MKYHFRLAFTCTHVSTYITLQQLTILKGFFKWNSTPALMPVDLGLPHNGVRSTRVAMTSTPPSGKAAVAG